jgi:ParB-like chromosome segregation protein Spo0J
MDFIAQIVSSIGEVGIIEPPVVARDPPDIKKLLLLDGHLHLEALKDMGETSVDCLVSPSSGFQVLKYQLL